MYGQNGLWKLSWIFYNDSYGKNTRNNKCLLKLPLCRTEVSKKSVSFMATNIYNRLPLDIRQTDSYTIVSDKVNCFFAWFWFNILLCSSGLTESSDPSLF